MGVTLHPSQKRSSCEACRKHKMRCKREEPNTGRCTRCARLNLDCVLGQQKKVGRPRRSPTEETSPPTTNNSSQNTHNINPSPELTDFDMMSASGLDFGQDFGAFDGSLSAPNLDPFFMDSPSLGLGGTVRPSLMEFPFGISGDGSLPWDNIHNDFFQSTSSGSSTSWSSPSPSPPTPASNADQCKMSMHKEMMSFVSTPENPIAIDDAMSRLSKLNLDLHTRAYIIENNKDAVDFMAIVCTFGPLYINETTFVQFMVATTQDFVKILARLRRNNEEQEATPPPAPKSYLAYGLLSPFSQPPAVEPSSLHSSPSEAGLIPMQDSTPVQPPACSQSLIKKDAVSLPVSLLITSIFVQLIALYEVLLEQVRQRMFCESATPFVPEMKPMNMGGIVLKDTCSIGIVFAELVNSLLQRSERILGTELFAIDGEAGIFTQSQKETLWRELGGNAGPAAGKTRSMHVRMGLDAAKKGFLEAAMSR